MMPENVVQMTFQRVQTVVVTDDLGGKPGVRTNASSTLGKRLQKAEGINVLGSGYLCGAKYYEHFTLGVIVCSVASGVALSRVGPLAKPDVADVVVVHEAVVMQLMDLVMW